MLNLLFEMLVAVQVDFVELILVDEVLSNFFKIVVCCPILLCRIGEEESTLFEGKRTKLS